MGINGKLPATVKFQVVDLGLGRVAFKTTEWRGDLLGGVTVIKGEFVNGKPMVAVPNYGRLNRGGRSMVWMKAD